MFRIWGFVFGSGIGCKLRTDMNVYMMIMMDDCYAWSNEALIML